MSKEEATQEFMLRFADERVNIEVPHITIIRENAHVLQRVSDLTISS